MTRSPRGEAGPQGVAWLSIAEVWIKVGQLLEAAMNLEVLTHGKASTKAAVLMCGAGRMPRHSRHESCVQHGSLANGPRRCYIVSLWWRACAALVLFAGRGAVW